MLLHSPNYHLKSKEFDRLTLRMFELYFTEKEYIIIILRIVGFYVRHSARLSYCNCQLIFIAAVLVTYRETFSNPLIKRNLDIAIRICSFSLSIKQTYIHTKKTFERKEKPVSLSLAFSLQFTLLFLYECKVITYT